MHDFSTAILVAADLLLHLDSDLMEIILLSLQVTSVSVVLGTVIGLPVGAWLAIQRFATRKLWISLLGAFMGLPPVVVGLIVYLVLSSSGPFGVLDLLFTPAAMVIAQFVIVFPIIASLSCQAVQDLHTAYDEQLRSWNCSAWVSVRTLLWEGRFSLLTAVLAGFGRAIAEVGAVLIVGGNINHSTRVMTTTIALETSKGNLALALALGIILIVIALSVSFAVQMLRYANEA